MRKREGRDSGREERDVRKRRRVEKKGGGGKTFFIFSVSFFEVISLSNGMKFTHDTGPSILPFFPALLCLPRRAYGFLVGKKKQKSLSLSFKENKKGRT